MSRGMRGRGSKAVEGEAAITTCLYPPFKAESKMAALSLGMWPRVCPTLDSRSELSRTKSFSPRSPFLGDAPPLPQKGGGGGQCSPHGLAGNVRQVCGATLHLCPALSPGGCLPAHAMTSRVVPLLRACAECCPKRRRALNTCSATLCRAPFSREIGWRAVGAKEGQFWPPVWAWGKQGRLQVAGRPAS